jgi:hypothetical protein
VISQAHSFQWLGGFGNRGNGRYREELRKGLSAIDRYLADIDSNLRAPYSGSMANMGPESCSPIYPLSPL